MSLVYKIVFLKAKDINARIVKGIVEI